MRWSSVLVSLALLTLFALAMIGFRIAYTRSSDHIAIAWNLFLAWIPLVAALIAWNRARTDARGAGLVAAAVVWLAFLPNAPYMITDLKYIGYGDDVPVLYDVLLLSAAAWTGLLLGLASLLLMHEIGRRFVGTVRAWVLVVGVLGLCSFGIYLGRVQRWNSWDVFVRPGALLDAASTAAVHAKPIALTVLFTCFLLVTYLVLYSFASGRPRVVSRYQALHEAIGMHGASPRPRLMFVITLAEPGGAQTYLSSLLPAVAEHFDVTVAAHGPGPLWEAARAAGVRFVPLEHVRRPVNPFRDVLGLLELMRLFRHERPEIVHASSSKAGVVGRLAAVLAGVPIRIFTVHGWAFAAYGGLAGRLYLWADRLVRPLTTLTICVSERELELGLRARTCATERAVVVHNAVDVGEFQSAQTHGVPPRIISVGRFAYPKDYATLVQGLAAVDSDFRAVLVGEGPARPAVERDIRDRGLADRVEVVGGRDDVPELLAEADLFVLSSRSEGLPISVLEAMAAGLAVVASDVGGMSELVTEGETGLLVPPADANALAAVLERVIRDGELRDRFGAAGRSRVEQRFDLTTFREAHVELYRRELERCGLRSPDSALHVPGDDPRLRRHVVAHRSRGT